MKKKRSNSPKRTTIIDVSRKTGYSIATISRALNNYSNVREETKKKVRRVAKAMHYIPNMAARSLIKGKSRLIGLILPDTSAIYTEFTYCLHKYLVSKGYQIFTYYSDNDAKRQHHLIKQLRSQQVEGIALSPVPGKYKDIEELSEVRFPMVIVNRFIKDYPVSNILFDFRRGISQAIDLLVQKGRRHFYQMVRQDIYYGKERREIFYFSLKVNGITYPENHSFPVNDDFSSAYGQMSALLDKKEPADAVFCSSDFVALGVIRACFDRNLRVPEDISIVGCYNSDFSQFVSPRLSTINADFRKLAQVVGERLLAQIDKNENAPVNRSIETSFIEREST